ncbi:hypothetical protein [Methanobrevibacter sp. AbM4]|uniref:hypothetical protein n=1 Tax=Methanobrevibacter sp. AbM4 TaxID=224719 RepID=UPI0003348963|nr:hypothetical protein [Methanobrevibacter sp. AbM4]AGN17434.1 hypothetical protein Abm4_1565 [Methanobrevibacter sp. AbM4]
MKELKADHQAGKISDEKYKELSRQYMIKLKNIDASSRIRAMQGRQFSSSSKPNRNYRPDRRAAELSRKEDERLVQKYIVNPKRPVNNNKPKASKSNKGKYSILVVLFLIIAFTAGIGFGMFNFDFQAVNISDASAVVTDSAFPVVIENNTTSNVTSTSTSDSGSSDTTTTTASSDSASSTTTSSDTGGSSSGGSDTGGSDSGGSDSGGSDTGGSDSGGSSSGGSTQ